jgi:hypothetical protein
LIESKKMNFARKKTEHEEQREFVAWFRREFPTVRIFAIPNGGARSPATAARLKVEGVSPGVPDIYIPAWQLWVEMKTATGGKLSAAQAEWKKYLGELGHGYILANGFEDGAQKVCDFLEKLENP